jgi:hypothetical protein
MSHDNETMRVVIRVAAAVVVVEEVIGVDSAVSMTIMIAFATIEVWGG